MEKEIKCYQQRGDTCAIVCMLMVLEYYGLIPEVNKYYEDKYYRIYKSKYMEGTPLGALAWHFAKNGLDTEIVHSNKEIFNNDKGFIDKDIYGNLMGEYKTFLRQAEGVGARISNGIDLNPNLIKEKLKLGYLVILAGEVDEVLHTVLISKYKDNMYVVNDPLYKEKQLWSEKEFIKYMDTEIGKWGIFVKDKRGDVCNGKKRTN